MASHVELDDLIRLGRIQHLAVQFDNIPTTIQVGEVASTPFFALQEAKIPILNAARQRYMYFFISIQLVF